MLRLLFLLLPILAAAQTYVAETRTILNRGADVRAIVIDPNGAFRVDAEATAAAPGWFATRDALWRSAPRVRVADLPAPAHHIAATNAALLVSTAAGLFRLDGARLVREPIDAVRQAAIARDGRYAAATASGFYLKRPGGAWERLFPRDGRRSWAPIDVRAVVFDSLDRLWFASPQCAGVYEGKAWTLYTGADGLPYDDFTTMTAAENGVVWFGTRIGAIRFDGAVWEYRQGPRWLPADEVRAIAATLSGDVWIATPAGVSVIARRPTTLADKARFFEEEIDKRHRRTPYGYVLEVELKEPGHLESWSQHDSDNDGLWTAMYGAGECFGYAATGSEDARRRAVAAFEALRFLGTVTQGGEHPAPRGFVARTVLPASGPDPNIHDSAARDREMRATRDRLWKDLAPRWPLSADRQWYWKADTSSDELDGHYFFYGAYYDLVARSDAEKRAVRDHVAALTDHLIDHGFQLIDHDGKPTRWGIFDPANLNHNVNFWQERGLNSLSMLAYLKVAEHITGDAKYARAYRRLIDDHAYDMNILIPKSNAGPGAGNQSDDEMIFMNYYGLLRYERDPQLRRKFLLAFHNHWKMEAPELNPLFNYLYAAIATGEKYADAFDDVDLSPSGEWREDALDTLRRFPADRVDWAYRNSHRIDIVRLPEYVREGGAALGRRVNGNVVPVDERYVGHWNHDPWRLDQNSSGRSLGDGAAFLLPYYLGLYLKLL